MSVMLALAHGVKGIMFWNYNSYQGSTLYVVGIVDENGNPSDLWYLIHDNLTPRLENEFGKTLLGLDYTGDYLAANNAQGDGYVATKDYLSIIVGGYMNYHSGLLEEQNNPYNKYFLLVNRLTNPNTDNKYCNMYINYEDVLDTYYNWCFRNIEGGIDTTFNADNYLQYTDYIEAGEGHLFQVAPVLMEGGILRYNETLSNQTNLNENLIIDENVTLTLNQTLNAYGNIYLKDGAKIITTYNQQGPYSPRINFYNGKKLIVEGDVEVTGTVDHNIVLNFVSSADSNGIEIKNDKLTMKHCNVSNAE